MLKATLFESNNLKKIDDGAIGSEGAVIVASIIEVNR